MKKVSRLILFASFMLIAILFSHSVGVFAEGEDTYLDPAMKLAYEAVSIMKVIGTCIAVAILGIYGIKWFGANGEKKADLKSRAWIYIVGAIMVFAGVQVGGWFVQALYDAVGVISPT